MEAHLRFVCFYLNPRKLSTDNRFYHFFASGDFRIDNTGTVFVNRVLDREGIATYSLVVGAYNYETKAFNETSRPRQRNVDGMISH